MSLPTVSVADTLRNRVAVRLANLSLRIADQKYRNFVRNSIWAGLECASGRSEQDPP